MKGITILGCGAWGTAVSRVIAKNVANSTEFDKKVMLYVEPEEFEGEPLTDQINRIRINFRYLPGFKIPKIVHATSDLDEACAHGDILALVYPTQYVAQLLERLKGKVKEGAYFITFCKGLIIAHPPLSSVPTLQLVSDLVRLTLNRPCYAVGGATTAFEVAWKQPTEATIGCADGERAKEIKRLLSTSYFLPTIVSDELGVELCGALKHVVAIAAGLIDGLQLGDNTKSTVLRLGFYEMFELMKTLYPNRGMSHRPDKPPLIGNDMDLINIYIGRNRAVASRKSEFDRVTLMVNVQGYSAADGTEYAGVINKILTHLNLVDNFPLFTAVHEICNQGLPPASLIDHLTNHPAHRG